MGLRAEEVGGGGGEGDVDLRTGVSRVVGGGLMGLMGEGGLDGFEGGLEGELEGGGYPVCETAFLGDGDHDFVAEADGGCSCGDGGDEGGGLF